jgi:AcrR family transcriptional regulator
MSLEPTESRRSRPGLLRGLRDQALPLLEARLEAYPPEGLRERKKRMTRQLISDTATGMFLEAGFDEVRVADVAAACGVSEKTVYNYFPTKESLIFDRFEDMEADVRHVLGPDAPPSSPVDAIVTVIVAEVQRMFDTFDEGDRAFDVAMIRRFAELVQQTPALRAALREMTEKVVQVAAEAMAARAGVNPEDPEPQIAAHAICGLWDVMYFTVFRYSDGSHTGREMREAVIADVRRAARLIDTGLWSFGLAVQGSDGREQVRLAAESANEARKQVLSAIRQARQAWRLIKAEAHQHERHEARARRPTRGGRSRPERGTR